MASDVSVKSPLAEAAVPRPSERNGGPGSSGEPGGISVRFRLRNNHYHEFAWSRSRSHAPSIFTIGVVKGGSSLLHRIVTDLAPHGPRTLVPLDRKFFRQGIDLNDVVEDTDRLFARPGYIFGTFRWLPRELSIPNLQNAKKVLLVRDPRDMLVSAYYSFKHSHGMPPSGPVRHRLQKARARLADVALDEYVKAKAAGVKRNYFKTMTLLNTPTTLLRRYEDIIFDKQSFVTDLAEFLETDASSAQVAAIAKKHDILPESEDTSRHVRQVRPRNFEAKLSPSTVEEITHELRAILCEFGYR